MTSERAGRIDTGGHPLVDGNPPIWANGWGQDEYGVWVEFTLAPVSQRLRWIPPGVFQMGSTDKPGRFEWEYACRADEPGAIYTGGLEVVGDANAPALDHIAWYGATAGSGSSWRRVFSLTKIPIGNSARTPAAPTRWA